jgi:hypothetical protein
MWDMWCTKWHCDGFVSEFFGFPCQYHSAMAVHIHVTWGMNSSSVCDRSSETSSRVIDMINNNNNNNKLTY